MLGTLMGGPRAASEVSVEQLIEHSLETSAWRRAVELASDWVKDEPDNADAHFWLALSLRSKMESVSRLRAVASVRRYARSLDRAIALDPDHVRARQERIGYRIFAPGIAGGDRETAREEIETLHEIDEVAAWQMRAVLADAEGDAEALSAALERLRQLDQTLDGSTANPPPARHGH
jgi:hypothetical protein